MEAQLPCNRRCKWFYRNFDTADSPYDLPNGFKDRRCASEEVESILPEMHPPEEAADNTALVRGMAAIVVTPSADAFGTFYSLLFGSRPKDRPLPFKTQHCALRGNALEKVKPFDIVAFNVLFSVDEDETF